MAASPPNAAPSQFDATQFHSEFGYLAPTMRFRRKAALTLKGGALGALIGAIVVFVVVMDREEKAFTMLSTPALSTTGLPEPAHSPPAPSTAAPATRVSSTPALPSRVSAPTSPASASPTPASPALNSTRAAAVDGWSQVRFVPESLALPAAVPAGPPVRSAASPAVAAPLDLRPAVPVIAAAPVPADVKAVAKPKKETVREPQPGRTARPAPVQPEPRSAYAAEPSLPRFFRSIFGLGLQ